MLLSRYAICGTKKSRLIKEQEAKGILCSLVLCFKCNFIGDYKMNEIVNKFLLTGDTFMPEMHLKQPGFTQSACGPFTKNKERIQKLKEAGDLRYMCRNEMDKACFQYSMAYGDFEDLAKRTASDKVLRNKAFDIAKNPKYDRYQRGLASMVYVRVL